MADETAWPRPPFVDEVAHAYNARGKRLVLVTGNVLDSFASPAARGFLPLEQAIYREWQGKFLVLRMDMATGVSLYDEADRQALAAVCRRWDAIAPAPQRLGDVGELMERHRYEPLPTLVLLQRLSDAVLKLRAADPALTKPLCIVMQFAGSMVPEGDFDRLSEVDRQRLVTLLNWINDPLYVKGANLLVLVSGTRSEVNRRLLALPAAHTVEIALPAEAERARFVRSFVERAERPVTFAAGEPHFVADTAGLKLTSIDDLLETAARSGDPVTRATVLAEVNLVIQAELGDIIRVSIPQHGPDDIVGSDATKDILRSVFARCENPETAISAVLVSGPNGGGKTFQMEAFAAASGRIVIELTGLRSMWYGGTDKQFERLLWFINTFGKVLLLVDEAHTAFGSVHKSDTHETERRLAGNFIKMVGDPKLRGKLLLALMTSRPDELDPDLKSRSPLQLPIFDPEGAARKAFVTQLFTRKGVALEPAQADELLARTTHYSARDFDNLVREVKAQAKPVLDVLQVWQASTSIFRQRRLQTLIASQHCSYPQLLPDWLKNADPEAVQREIEGLKVALQL
jgi:AAA+ superfamily predicted ATPase